MIAAAWLFVCSCRQNPSDPAKIASSKPVTQPNAHLEIKPIEQVDPKKEAAQLVTDKDSPPVRKDGTIFADAPLMGTLVSINLWLDPQRTPADGGAAIRAAFNEMARIESFASEWRKDSTISKLNQKAGGPAVAVEPELIQILSTAHQISERTQGRFDVTFHSVGSLWKFEEGSRPPSRKAVEHALPLVNYRQVEIDPKASTLRLTHAGMKIGLGAIAKGFAVDAAARVLRKHSFDNFVVEAGGDTLVSGLKGGKKQGRKWAVGVQNPKEAGSLGILESSDEAIVTSGSYFRRFEYEGVTYTHILDPRTGWPIPEATSPMSVTVVASSATFADAMCTALAVMGTEEGMRFVESQSDLEAIFVDSRATMHISSGLRSRFRKL